MLSAGPLRGHEMDAVTFDVPEGEAKSVGELTPLLLFIRYFHHLMVVYSEETWDETVRVIEEQISITASASFQRNQIDMVMMT